MSDKWDEIAKTVLPSRMERIDIPGTAERYEAKVAAALRSAYAEGERAGMERAEFIANFWHPVCRCASTIRAAKEAKQENI